MASHVLAWRDREPGRGLQDWSRRITLGQLSRCMSNSPMDAISIHEAKSRLSQLVEKAAAGEDVVISRNGKPLVRITRLAGPRNRIRFGVLEGRVYISQDFNAPLPDDALAGFEGR
jgi:prevent-host-death family protein